MLLQQKLEGIKDGQIAIDKTDYSKFQRQIYRELDQKEERCDDDQTVAEVTKVCVFSEDVGMEFGIKKCAILVMEKGKIVKSVGIEIPDGQVIKSLQ